MPFDVDGWIETKWDSQIDEGVDNWCGTVKLTRFMLSGDEVSDVLFGLAKAPYLIPHFPKRGIPEDASEDVKVDTRANEAFWKEHNEGDFGHTYALYSEVKPLLAEVDAALASKIVGSAESQNSWVPVFAILETLTRHGFPPGSLRLVVWGNW